MPTLSIAGCGDVAYTAMLIVREIYAGQLSEQTR